MATGVRQSLFASLGEERNDDLTNISLSSIAGSKVHGDVSPLAQLNSSRHSSPGGRKKKSFYEAEDERSADRETKENDSARLNSAHNFNSNAFNSGIGASGSGAFSSNFGSKPFESSYKPSSSYEPISSRDPLSSRDNVAAREPFSRRGGISSYDDKIGARRELAGAGIGSTAGIGSSTRAGFNSTFPSTLGISGRADEGDQIFEDRPATRPNYNFTSDRDVKLNDSIDMNKHAMSNNALSPPRSRPTGVRKISPDAIRSNAQRLFGLESHSASSTQPISPTYTGASSLHTEAAARRNSFDASKFDSGKFDDIKFGGAKVDDRKFESEVRKDSLPSEMPIRKESLRDSLRDRLDRSADGVQIGSFLQGLSNSRKNSLVDERRGTMESGAQSSILRDSMASDVSSLKGKAQHYTNQLRRGRTQSNRPVSVGRVGSISRELNLSRERARPSSVNATSCTRRSGLPPVAPLSARLPTSRRDDSKPLSPPRVTSRHEEDEHKYSDGGLRRLRQDFASKTELAPGNDVSKGRYGSGTGTATTATGSNAGLSRPGTYASSADGARDNEFGHRERNLDIDHDSIRSSFSTTSVPAIPLATSRPPRPHTSTVPASGAVPRAFDFNRTRDYDRSRDNQTNETGSGDFGTNILERGGVGSSSSGYASRSLPRCYQPAGGSPLTTVPFSSRYHSMPRNDNDKLDAKLDSRVDSRLADSKVDRPRYERESAFDAPRRGAHMRNSSLDRFRIAQREGDLVCTCPRSTSQHQQRELVHMNSKWKDCTSKFSRFREQKRDLQRELDSLKPFDAKIEEEKHRRQHAKDRLRRAEEELEREKSNVEELERKNDELDLDLRQAKDQVAALSSRQLSDDDLRSDERTMRELEDKLRHLPSMNELSRMQHEISCELSHAKSALDSQQWRYERAKTKYDQIEQTTQQNREKYKSLQHEKQNLERNFEDLCDREERQSKEVMSDDNYMFQIETLNKQERQLQRDLQSAEDERKEIEKRHDNVKLRRKILKDKQSSQNYGVREARQRWMMEHDQKASQLTKKHNDLNDALTSLHEELGNLNLQKDRTERELSNRTQHLDDVRAECNDLSQRLDEMRRHKDNMDRQLTERKHEFAGASDRSKVSHADVEAMKRQIYEEESKKMDLERQLREHNEQEISLAAEEEAIREREARIKDLEDTWKIVQDNWEDMNLRKAGIDFWEPTINQMENLLHGEQAQPQDLLEKIRDLEDREAAISHAESQFREQERRKEEQDRFETAREEQEDRFGSSNLFDSRREERGFVFGQAETTFDHRVQGALRSGHDRGALYGAAQPSRLQTDSADLHDIHRPADIFNRPFSTDRFEKSPSREIFGRLFTESHEPIQETARPGWQPVGSMGWERSDTCVWRSSEMREKQHRSESIRIEDFDDDI